MTDFAGAGAGPVYDEQIFLGDRWLTFRSRGPGDAIFSPTTKTPYTDELVLGYSTTFGQNMNLSVIYTKRETKDIFEDYDLGLYSNRNGDTEGGQADENSDFYLPDRKSTRLNSSQEGAYSMQSSDRNTKITTS